MRTTWASQSGRSYRLGAIAIIAVVALLAVGIAVTPTVNQLLHVERVYPGVQVAGVDVSGQTEDQAAATIGAKLQEFEGTSLKLIAGDKEFTLAASELGFQPRDSELAQVAFDEARELGALGFIQRAVFGLDLGPAEAPEASLVDHAVLDAAVAKMAAESYRAPVDAVLTLQPEVSLKPSAVGQELDQAAARDVIRDQLVAMTADDLDLPMHVLAPKVTTEQLQPFHDQAAAILEGGMVLNTPIPTDSRGWTIPKPILQDSLVFQSDQLALDVKTEVIAPVVAQAARDVYLDPSDAALAIKDGQVILTPDQDGKTVDQAATLAKVKEGILAGANMSSLVVNSVPAKVKTVDLQSTADEAQAIIAKGLTVTVDGTVGTGGNEAVDKSFTATPAEMGTIVSLNRAQDGKYSISLNADAIGKAIDRMNAAYQYPSLTARFVTWSNGRPVIRQGAKVAAVVIDKQKAVAAITDKYRDGKVTVSATMGQMTIDKPFADRLRKDLKGTIGTRSIQYRSASPERSHNIALALKRINGTVVAPGEVYSFNISTGPTTIAAGYRWGFAFTTKNGQNVVVPSEAGGICQVATSVFQPVFLAGYMIEERNYHMFNIGSYAVRGYRGMDATVYPPYADFKFRNNTDQYMMISSTNHGKSTYVALVGTKPNWKVSISPERRYNYVAPPSKPIYSTSSHYAKGRTITLEHPTPGLTTEFTRTVTTPDGQKRTLTLKSVYKASPLQVLVGTG